MKKKYIRPEQCVVVLQHSQSLLNGSPIILVNPEPGGDVDPGTQVDTGLSRDYSGF